MQVSLVLLSLVLSFTELPLTSARLQPWGIKPYADRAEEEQCKGTNYTQTATKTFLCGDWRLGPSELIDDGAVSDKEVDQNKAMRCILKDYDRLAKLAPGAFISKFTDKNNGYWVYPSASGFANKTDGQEPDTKTITLQKGDYVDRFGGENGYFLAPAGTLYTERSIPPSNLNTQSSSGTKQQNFYVYRVLKPFEVLSGPIAPWFGQPGGGVQYYTKSSGNIGELKSQGKLEDVSAKDLVNSGKMKCQSGSGGSGGPLTWPEPHW
ncbi:hypothetical protein QQS21_012209 [Conoideocrella luteorostrata]|uniref:TNT domain-containing protein n=1 Tax=Conoideocrella luteorostrata TaxID=1105319 RepID=A0AAJ0FML0_9HYPO|nr:hypothetical protein QQS21_012209 [Conoideocrella luteorostrata]